MTKADLQSWGRLRPSEQGESSIPEVQTPYWTKDLALNQHSDNTGTFLPRGQGRSYGDVCLNYGANNTLLHTDNLNRLISFDRSAGILTAEAGITLDQILQFLVPQRFFLPVSPGTKFVSLGGAIANDIHGKNHHVAGTFGRFVQRLSLLRSSGEVLECSPQVNSDLFNATIGGIGLTGIILNATISLVPIESAQIDQRVIKFQNLKEFFELSIAKEEKSTYTVAWIDCLATHEKLGRGHFISGEHSTSGTLKAHTAPKIICPIEFPSWALNQVTVRAFNTLYYNRQRQRIDTRQVHYDPFFYPLDSVYGWNKIYGKKGFVQFQCVIPPADKVTGIEAILNAASKSRTPSFLAVLKEFGSIPSPGLLSFPSAGATICLDFGFRGQETIALMHRLESITRECGGRIYQAKDALMSKASFHAMYPKLSQFLPHVDPKFSSSFIRRVL